MRQGIPHLSLEINQRPSQVLITFDVRRNARSSLTHGFGAIPAFDSAQRRTNEKLQTGGGSWFAFQWCLSCHERWIVRSTSCDPDL